MNDFLAESSARDGEKPGNNGSGRVVDLSSYSDELVFAKVLVLEDDADMREVLEEYLGTVPYEVVAVENGVEGLRKVLAESFDAIVCDMMMPGLAGDLFYLGVERTKPELCRRFVFITAHNEDEKIKYFIRDIGGTMLVKPFRMEDLRSAIEYVLRDAELRRALKKPIRKRN